MDWLIFWGGACPVANGQSRRAPAGAFALTVPYVHEAVADSKIRPLVDQLIREEAAPTIEVAPGQDLAAYADALLARFDNPTLHHRLTQIAMDGSQKIPQRWLETIALNRTRGQDCPAIISAISAWLRHLTPGGTSHAHVSDPMVDALLLIITQPDRSRIVGDIFGIGGLLGQHFPLTPRELNQVFF